MAHRYFTTDIHGEAASLTGPDAAHLAKVLRAAPGQRLTLCDGAGFDYAAEITAVSRDEITLKILAKAPSATEPNLWAEVFIGMAKGERMDYAIQKSVELGASAIRPFFSQNTVVKPKNEEEKTRRFARIAAEAAKQSGRGILPLVHPPVGFGEALRRAAETDLPLFFYEENGIPLPEALAALPAAEKRPGRTIALITGAEGGFTPAEAAEAAATGCRTVHLGPRILRCETAPAAALAVVMALTGNLQ